MFLVSVTVSLHVFENVRYFEVLFRFVSRIPVFSSSPLFNHLLTDVFSYVVPVPGFNDVNAYLILGLLICQSLLLLFSIIY